MDESCVSRHCLIQISSGKRRNFSLSVRQVVNYELKMIALLRTIILSLTINIILSRMTDFRENPVYNFNYFTFVITPKENSPVYSSSYPSPKRLPEQSYYIQVNQFYSSIYCNLNKFVFFTSFIFVFLNRFSVTAFQLG